MSVNKKTLIRRYVKAIHEGNAAVFAGAGLSRSSGYVDWRGLLRPLAEEIGLDVDKEYDLLSVAQFYKNKRPGTPTSQAILDAFSKEVSTNENIKILSRLPIFTYWTTNYDELLENGIKNANRNPDVKYNYRQLSYILPDRDAVVYKMHGDVKEPDMAVLTKTDYELYQIKYPLFRTILKGDLISKTFLFIGFSFQDPNLDYVLGQIHSLIGDNAKEHFCFVRRVQESDYPGDPELYAYFRARQELQEENLKNYSIQTVFVDSFAEITDILRDIEKATKMRNVFVSGSAVEFSSPWDKASAESFVAKLAGELVHANCKITSGFGWGIGSAVVNGALKTIYSEKYKHVDEHLCLRPFPLDIIDPEEKRKQRQQYRNDMIVETGVSIFVFGNKIIDGEMVESPGCMEEFEIAKKQGNLIIPVGSTGYAAKKILDEIKDNIKDYVYLTDYIDVLEKETDADILIEAIIKIIKDKHRQMGLN
ncbi:SIR2 family protein [Aristaeella lactis]|uniref:SIR2-like domain-containing protein n=1 Tax=Aristaeella lactis TaxID=3046383 RepID=A0AC61PL73_9FIRM|nr:SIR2 family protein [Aristaeella lactis]QUA52171.1 SIR2 family protein [Aristaeella lactis]SMC58383.1 SIR2-like domain-containing protein [Aristaeella lactis]